MLFGFKKLRIQIISREQGENALRENEKNLRELNTAKDKFFSIIAHDLKSPFNSLLGFSNLLTENFDSYDSHTQKKYIEYIRQGVGNTYKLLENLLLWSQTQKGVIDFKPESINLYLFTTETFQSLRQFAEGKAISINNEIPENTFVKADKNMLATIMRNLISNAIKFTPKGGKIYLNANLISKINIQSYIEISVKDSGVGIAKEKLNQLFKISENISTKGTEGEAGTGLGLILCREFVEKHGGEIYVESVVNKGSKFIFTIPLSINS